MRISFKWLQDYIELKNTAEEVAKTLTSIGLEVESIEYLGKKYDGFVTGEVIEVQKHPNADRLTVCSVRISKNGSPQQIVCGAPNVASGQKVIVGLPGATVPKNQHDPNGNPFTLAKAKIRGVESNGMICSEYELGIGNDKEGIAVLDAKTEVGIPLSKLLGLDDVVFEIGVTPNRPDCLSHIGVARDLAAVYETDLKLPHVTLTGKKNSTIHKLASVKVENTDACPRYVARLIQNVNVKESPQWLKEYLNAAGLRPINNIVDVTNFVMLEYGQPLHAFDYDQLAKSMIVVKNSSPKEKFTTLDGRTHELNGSELMICDGERPVAIGGVMGGINSEISTTTKNVLLEAAYFSPTSIRKTSKRLGISTDASYRFERGTDPNIVDEASKRAASLIAELSGGSLADDSIDVYPKKIEPKDITLRHHRIEEILGVEISSQKIKSLLKAIGIHVRIEHKNFHCTVPTYRPDIEQEIDLIEEIARLYGYDNIPNHTSGETVFSEPSAYEHRINEIRKWCESIGLHEIITNSLIDEHGARQYSSELIRVKNPLSVELAIMRPSLLPTMLDAVAYNYNHGATTIRFFEIGNTFLAKNSSKKNLIKGVSEHTKLGIILSGNNHEGSWFQKERAVDIFDLKGLVQSLLEKLALDNIHLIYYDASSSLTERTIGIEINGTYAGFLGECSEKILQSKKIENAVFFAELDVDVLLSGKKHSTFREFSKFPTVKRDVAFIVNKQIAVGDVEATIREAGGELVTSVTLFDIFEGASLGEDKKSIAFRISINSDKKTLTDADIDRTVDAITKAVTSTHGATLRKL